MIDLAVANKLLRQLKTSDLGLATTDNKMADSFLKIMHPKLLLKSFKDQVISHSIEKWIVGFFAMLFNPPKKNGAEIISSTYSDIHELYFSLLISLLVCPNSKSTDKICPTYY